MTLGLSTYAYLWRLSERSPRPMTLTDVLRDVAEREVELFQIGDWPPLDTADDDELLRIRSVADSLGIRIEVGTRGTHPSLLRRYLRIARVLDAKLVRTLWSDATDRPDAQEVRRRLQLVAPEFESAGVALALETYEQVDSSVLVETIAAVDSPAIGICLDPANSVANLELPADVVGRCAPFTKNWHVKDFEFTRSPGWVGFQYTGALMGTGLLDYPAVRDAVRPDERGISQIIEFWLPWQDHRAGDAAENTIRMEADWTTHTIDYIRSNS